MMAHLNAHAALAADVPLDPWKYNQGTPAAEVPIKLLPEFAKFVKSKVPAENIQGTLMIRKILSKEAAHTTLPVNTVIEAGCLPRFIAQLGPKSKPELQFDSVWALSVIASAEKTGEALSEAVPQFVRLLGSENCREHAANAIANMAVQGAKYRDRCLESGAMKHLLAIVTDPKYSRDIVRKAAVAVSNLCIGHPPPKHDDIEKALPIAVTLLKESEDKELIASAAWACVFLADGPAERIQLLFDAGCLPRMLELLGTTNIHPALCFLRNCVAGNDEQVQVVLNAGILKQFGAFLGHNKRIIRKEVCGVLSAVVAKNNGALIQSVIDENLFPVLMNATKAFEADVKKEALKAIITAIQNSSKAQVDYLVENRVLQCLCVLLRAKNVELLKMGLEGIARILEVGDRHRHAITKLGNNGGEHRYANDMESNAYADEIVKSSGFSRLHSLQSHEDHEVRGLAERLLGSYFDVPRSLLKFTRRKIQKKKKP